MMKRLFAFALVLSFISVLPACNTMEGAGKDIKKGGEKIEDAAK